MIFLFDHREAQEFVEKFEGALGKGKGQKLYAFKVMMAKVIWSIFINWKKKTNNKTKQNI